MRNIWAYLWLHFNSKFFVVILLYIHIVLFMRAKGIINFFHFNRFKGKISIHNYAFNSTQTFFTINPNLIEIVCPRVAQRTTTHVVRLSIDLKDGAIKATLIVTEMKLRPILLFVTDWEPKSAGLTHCVMTFIAQGLCAQRILGCHSDHYPNGI